MKHVPNGREERETAREGTQEPINKQPGGAISSQRTKPRAELRRRSLEAESRYTAATVGLSQEVSQKAATVGRSQEVSRHSAEDQYWQSLDATRLATAQQCKKTERHLDQLLHSRAGDLIANNDHAVAEYHTVMLETPVSRRGRVFREKDRPYVQSTRGLTSFSRKDNGEFGTSRKLVGTSVRLVGGEWKIYYVRRTRDDSVTNTPNIKKNCPSRFFSDTFFFEPLLVDNMLTGLFSPTIRNVTGGETCSSRFFLTGKKSVLVDNMLTGVFSVFEEKCVTHVPSGHEHLLITTSLQLGLHFITCSVFFWCTFFHCLPKSFRNFGLVAQVL